MQLLFLKGASILSTSEKLSSYQELFSTYTELRIQENKKEHITLLNGACVKNNSTSIKGSSVRLFKDGYWAISSQPHIDSESIKRMIHKAEKNVAYLSFKSTRDKTIFYEPASSTLIKNFAHKPSSVKTHDKIDILKQMDEHIIKKYPDLISRTLHYNTLQIQKELFSSSNTYVNTVVPNTYIRIQLVMQKFGETVSLSTDFGGLGQFEDYFLNIENLYSDIEFLYEKLKDKASGIIPDAGIKDVILNSDLAGILAHEAIGHTTEADFVLNGSIAADYIGQQIASPMITLTDFANHAFGTLCHQPVFIDDEGILAQDVVIIEDGILKSFMHNRESSASFNTNPKGNARAFNFYDEPLIRMRNTCIHPGHHSLNDMIKSIDNGYYLMSPTNGQADSTSEFMFGVQMGYEIKNGKLGRAIKDTTVSGVAFDLLKTVSMISDKIGWESSGMCGKKQLIPVSMGGPAIKCKINIGGR